MRITKKPSGRVFFFFAVSRVSRLTRLTAKKKNHTTIQFFCYAHLQRKKKLHELQHTRKSSSMAALEVAAGEHMGSTMHKYTQNQSYVGSIGQILTTNVSMTLCS